MASCVFPETQGLQDLCFDVFIGDMRLLSFNSENWDLFQSPSHEAVNILFINLNTHFQVSDIRYVPVNEMQKKYYQ